MTTLRFFRLLKRLIAAALAALLALFTLLFFTLMYLRLTPSPEGFPILEYHMISDKWDAGAYDYAVPPEDFARQLDYLQSKGYTTITLIEYMKMKKGKLPMPEKPIILTFDDGYEDNYQALLPMLEERGMKGVVFMVTNDIDRKGYLTWDQLHDMQARGIEIGSHTANHLPLTTLSAAEQQDEVYLSKLLMEWRGLPTVFAFSYPNGAYDASHPELLKQNEYLCAVTGDAGLNNDRTDPYLLQRTNIPHPRFGLYEFALRLAKADLMTRLGWGQHQLKE